jgi:arsenate reductase
MVEDAAAGVPIAKRASVLFVCVRNAGRSQMAEALLRAYHGDRYEAFSAGTQPSEINPLVVKVLKEKEIDISTARSKTLAEFKDRQFDFVVTLCDDGEHGCAAFPGGKTNLHQIFPDPTKIQGNEEAVLTALRELLHQLRAWIDATFGKKEEKKVEEQKKTVMKVEMDG